MRRLRNTALILLSILCLLTLAPAASAQGNTSQGDTTMDLTLELRLSEAKNVYYVSSSTGSDQNDGRHEDTPWKSFAPLFDLDLEPGDRVLLRRGDVWQERLTIRGRGRADAWIFVGAYGDEAAPMPEISLSNGKDDIGILATDISAGARNGFGLDYIWIDNIHVSHAFLGIYFRYDTSVDNRGIRVTNCRFTDINCPELMEEALTDVSFLLQKKGHLEDYQNGRLIPKGGGEAEYVWPTAINVGGRPPRPLADVTVEGIAEPATIVSEIELYQNSFTDCVIAVGANCYNYHYGTGPNQCYTYTTNWRVRGLTAENTMTVINIDSADFGYDGTSDSPWGRWSHIQATGGMADYTMSFGTTQALFSCCRNLHLSRSSFNGSRNNGQADGCGLDFERSVHGFTLDSCIFANNQGQGILVMQTTMENQVTGEQAFTPNTNNVIESCLFYNNMTSVHSDNYRFDITVFNPNNEGFLLRNNTFYFREKTAGGATVAINALSRKSLRPYGPEGAGFTEEGSTLVQGDSMPPLDEVLAELHMESAALAYLPVAKTWYRYTDEGARPPETEAPGETRAPTESTDENPARDTDKATDGEGVTAGDDPPATGCASALRAVAPACAAAVSAVCAAKRGQKRREH